MPAFVFLELGVALILVVGVWGWLRWHRPPDAPNRLAERRDEDSP